jgi:hypothetical protein
MSSPDGGRRPSKRAQELAPQILTRMQPIEWALLAKVVMPGLVPGIHVLKAKPQEDVDGRDEPGHDGKTNRFQVI